MQRKSFLIIGFLVLLVALCAVFSWMLFGLVLPRPDRSMVGKPDDFTDLDAPRLFWQDSTPFYVLNVNGELIALYAISSRGVRCRIQWDSERQRFVDPCYGTRMLRDGTYEGGGPPLDMNHLPLHVEDGMVWVEADTR